MKRTRTISEEGQRLYLNSLCIPRPSKKSIKQFLFSCFHSEYDDKISHVVRSCREATKTLYPMLLHENIDKKLDAGISNTTKLILSNDNKKVTLHTVKQNVSFFLNVLQKAYTQEDHQTAMMIYIALNHSSVQRLNFKRPKKMSTLFNELKYAYGDGTKCYSKHIHETIRQKTSNYLPSLIAVSMYVGKNNTYKKAYRNMGHHLNQETIQKLQTIMNTYSCINTKAKHSINLYHQEQLKNTYLYQLSNDIQNKKYKKLTRTRKQILKE